MSTEQKAADTSSKRLTIEEAQVLAKLLSAHIAGDLTQAEDIARTKYFYLESIFAKLVSR